MKKRQLKKNTKNMLRNMKLWPEAISNACDSLKEFSNAIKGIARKFYDYENKNTFKHGQQEGKEV